MDIRVTAIVAHYQSITARYDCRPTCDAAASDWATDPLESVKVHFSSEMGGPEGNLLRQQKKV